MWPCFLNFPLQNAHSIWIFPWRARKEMPTKAWGKTQIHYLYLIGGRSYQFNGPERVKSRFSDFSKSAIPKTCPFLEVIFSTGPEPGYFQPNISFMPFFLGSKMAMSVKK